MHLLLGLMLTNMEVYLVDTLLGGNLHQKGTCSRGSTAKVGIGLELGGAELY